MNEIFLRVRPLHILFYNRRLSQCLFHDDSVALLLVLVLANPHVFEVGQLAQNAASAPAHDVSLRRGEYPDLDLLAGELLHLVQETLGETLEHGIASGEYNVVIKALPQVDVHLRKTVQHQLRKGCFKYRSYMGILDQCVPGRTVFLQPKFSHSRAPAPSHQAVCTYP